MLHILMQSMRENNTWEVGVIDHHMWLWPGKLTQSIMGLMWTNNTTQRTSSSIAAHN